MRRLLCSLAFVVALVYAPAFAKNWPEPLNEALSNASEKDKYSYRMTIESENYFIEALVDPSKPPGQQLEIRFPPPGSESGDVVAVLKEMRGESPRSIWCSSVSDAIPEKVRLEDETDESLIYWFKPIIDPEARKREKQVFKKLEGRVVIDKMSGTVRSYRMKNPKNIKPAIVAVIRTFLIESECELAPNGRSYRAKHVFSIDGAALGNRFGETVTTTVSNLSPVQEYQSESNDPM